MTRQSHDQFAKSLLSGFLDLLGRVQVSLEVSDEPRFVDLFFEPDPTQNPGSLGLLGRLAEKPCLIEPFRNPVQGSDIRNCLLKTLMVQAQRERKQESLPDLWILTPTCSHKVLKSVRAESDPNWPRGMYLLSAELRTGVVVIHQLPTRSDTLWLRLLGRGKVQKRAIQEVIDLGEKDPNRLRILELLGNWKIMLDQKQELLKEEERELMMNLSPAYLEWREKTLVEGIQIGEERGKQEGIQIGEERGKQEGIQIGEERGKQEGIQIGKQEGIQIGKQTAVPILAELGLSSNEIAQRLALTPEDVQRILNPE